LTKCKIRITENAQRPGSAAQGKRDGAGRMSPFTMEDHIKLVQFLKWQGLVDSGGEASHAVREGLVKVNGEVDTRRGRKLRGGDRVQVGSEERVVDLAPPPSPPVP
jgi:ribosome-associated protein